MDRFIGENDTPDCCFLFLKMNMLGWNPPAGNNTGKAWVCTWALSSGLPQSLRCRHLVHWLPLFSHCKNFYLPQTPGGAVTPAVASSCYTIESLQWSPVSLSRAPGAILFMLGFPCESGHPRRTEPLCHKPSFQTCMLSKLTPCTSLPPSLPLALDWRPGP